MIAPTVRHAMRISSVTALFEHCVASQATVWSKARVCPAPCRAHGTCATTTPCSAQRHPRRVGLHERPHRAHIQRPPATPSLARRRSGRTAAGTPRTGLEQPAYRPHTSDQQPLDPRRTRRRSTTVFSTPNRARHTLALRTPFSAHRFLTLDKPET